MTEQSTMPRPASADSRATRWAQQILRDATYIFLAFPAALAVWTTAVVLIATGAGLLVLALVGVALLIPAVWLVHGSARAEREVIHWVNPALKPQQYYSRIDEDAPWYRRALGPAHSGQWWTDLGWLMLYFPVSVATWSLAVAWLGGGLTSIVGGALNLPGVGIQWYGQFLSRSASIWLGVVCVITSPLVIRGMSWLQTHYSHALLNKPGQYRQQVEKLRASRTAAHHAESQSLRRLERDLHDGPQQHLVRLQMDIARSQRQMGQSPEEANRTLQEALARSHTALAELRQLSRGIAPPVLIDRGLAAALHQAAGTSAIPVSTRIVLPERMPLEVETAAYFCVTEALTNMNKHARATRGWLEAYTDQGTLTVVVTDDGQGGARRDRGSGLAGLEERVKGVDGTLTVDSPEGGPSIVKAVFPCA